MNDRSNAFYAQSGGVTAVRKPVLACGPVYSFIMDSVVISNYVCTLQSIQHRTKLIILYFKLHMDLFAVVFSHVCLFVSVFVYFHPICHCLLPTVKM